MMKFKYFEITLDDAFDSAGTGEGFIDPREATDEAFGGTLPTTLALSRDKARANLRWKVIVDALKETGMQDLIDVAVTAGDEDSPPTSITFKAVYESDKLVHAYDLITDTSGATLVGPDGFGAGETETPPAREQVSRHGEDHHPRRVPGSDEIPPRGTANGARRPALLRLP